MVDVAGGEGKEEGGERGGEAVVVAAGSYGVFGGEKTWVEVG